MQESGYIRRCTKCGATNREKKFNQYRRVCNECDRERAKNWRIDNPDKIAAYGKLRWQRTKNDPEKLAKERTRYEARNAKRRQLYKESADERYKQKERLRNYRARLSKTVPPVIPRTIEGKFAPWGDTSSIQIG